jgi:hypothetical protein
MLLLCLVTFGHKCDRVTNLLHYLTTMLSQNTTSTAAIGFDGGAGLVVLSSGNATSTSVGVVGLSSPARLNNVGGGVCVCTHVHVCDTFCSCAHQQHDFGRHLAFDGIQHYKRFVCVID